MYMSFRQLPQLQPGKINHLRSGDKVNILTFKLGSFGHESLDWLNVPTEIKLLIYCTCTRKSSTQRLPLVLGLLITIAAVDERAKRIPVLSAKYVTMDIACSNPSFARHHHSIRILVLYGPPRSPGLNPDGHVLKCLYATRDTKLNVNSCLRSPRDWIQPCTRVTDDTSEISFFQSS